MKQQIKIIRANRKSLSMKIDRDGIIVVRAPRFVFQKTIDNFIEKNKAWIEKQQSQRQKSILDPSQVLEYKREARDIIIPRVAEFAEKYGFTYNSVKITSAMTRWGSCTNKKNLNFTYRLALAPDEVRDYVIVHELCHLRQMNHSKKFWSEVAAIMPDYKQQEKWLKENWATIS